MEEEQEAATPFGLVEGTGLTPPLLRRSMVIRMATLDQARSCTTGMATEVFDLLCSFPNILTYAKKAEVSVKIVELFHNANVNVEAKGLPEEMGIASLLGVPLSQYFVLRALVQGNELKLNGKRQLEMKCGLKTDAASVEKMLEGGFIDRVGDHFVATQKAVKLIDSLKVGLSATAG